MRLNSLAIARVSPLLDVQLDDLSSVVYGRCDMLGKMADCATRLGVFRSSIRIGSNKDKTFAGLRILTSVVFCSGSAYSTSISPMSCVLSPTSLTNLSHV